MHCFKALPLGELVPQIPRPKRGALVHGWQLFILCGVGSEGRSIQFAYRLARFIFVLLLIHVFLEGTLPIQNDLADTKIQQEVTNPVGYGQKGHVGDTVVIGGQDGLPRGKPIGSTGGQIQGGGHQPQGCRTNG